MSLLNSALLIARRRRQRDVRTQGQDGVRGEQLGRLATLQYCTELYSVHCLVLYCGPRSTIGVGLDKHVLPFPTSRRVFAQAGFRIACFSVSSVNVTRGREGRCFRGDIIIYTVVFEAHSGDAGCKRNMFGYVSGLSVLLRRARTRFDTVNQEALPYFEFVCVFLEGTLKIVSNKDFE